MPDPLAKDDDTHESLGGEGTNSSLRQSSNLNWVRLAVLLIVGTTIIVGYSQWSDSLSLQRLAERESQFRNFQSTHPLLVYGIAFSVYVAVTGLSLPGAAPLSLLYAWFFGFVPGVVLVSFASTTGATLAFLLSRFLFRDLVISRFETRLKHFNESLQREGPYFLFTLRLIPAVPFFAINAVMGLTPIATRTFWWVSQLGMLPGTIVYVYAGSRVPSLQKLAEEGISAVFSVAQLTQIFAALAMLAAVPWIARRLLAKSIDNQPQP